MNITITGVDALKKQYDPKNLQQSLNRGLKRTTTTAVKEASQAVRAVYNIKAKDVKKNLKTRYQTEELKVIINIRSKSISLYDFGGKQISVKKRPKNSKRSRRYLGASAKVLKAGRRKKYKGAFVATVKGHTAIYRRKTEDRFPIRRLNVISPTTMFKKYGVKKIEAVFNRVFVERVLADYRYRTGQRK